MNTQTQPRTKKQIAQQLAAERAQQKAAELAGLQAMLAEEKAAATEAAKKPPAEFGTWGIVRTRAWSVKRAAVAKLIARKDPATAASLTKRIDLINFAVRELRRVSIEQVSELAKIAHPEKKEPAPKAAPRRWRGDQRHQAAR